jgi:hypothetical protein
MTRRRQVKPLTYRMLLRRRRHQVNGLHCCSEVFNTVPILVILSNRKTQIVGAIGL